MTAYRKDSDETKYVSFLIKMINCLFSENHIFRKQIRMTVYGRPSLVLDFKLTWKNDDLLPS